MTERVTIEGDGLTVTHDQPQPNPKRKRPERFASSVVPEGFRTVQDVIAQGNPYWTEEENAAADEANRSNHYD